MQMAISTTGRHPLCILCSVYVLSKMLKLRSAEGSSFSLWWMLSVFLLLKQHDCALHQTHWLLGSVRLVSNADVLTVMLSILRWGFVRWWACSGSNRLLLRFVFWSQVVGVRHVLSNAPFVDEVRFLISKLHHLLMSSQWSVQSKSLSECLGVWVGPRISEDLCLDAIGHCERSSVLLASRIAKVTLIGSFAA